MGLSYDDHKEVAREVANPPRWIRWLDLLVLVFRPAFRVPFIRRRLGRTMGGLQGTYFRCMSQEDYAEAAAIAVYGLEKYRRTRFQFLGEMRHHHWWSFMKMAVDALEQDDDNELKAKVIDLAKDGPQPFEGYDVAYSHLAFSRWRAREGDHDAAIAFAKTASRADDTWGEPDFILGRYALALDSGDPMEHLKRAVTRDPSIYFRIYKDEICRRYPHHLARLRDLSMELGLTVDIDQSAKPAGET